MNERSNLELVRQYTQRIFNEHSADLASEYLGPAVKWHGGLLGSVEGVANVAQMLRGFIGAPPDLRAPILPQDGAFTPPWLSRASS